MALFKHLYGNKDDAPQSVVHGHSYLMIDPEADAGTWGENDANTYGLGEWLVDIKENENDPGKRYRVAVARLIDDEGNIIEVSDLVQKTDLATEMGQQASDLRTALDVYSTTEVDDQPKTLTYTATLAKNSWVAPAEGEEFYTYVVSIPELKCGVAHNVSPLITWADAATKDDFGKIDLAEATPKDLAADPPVASGFITLSAKVRPNADSINILITDYQ